jgi:hypothetical protein
MFFESAPAGFWNLHLCVNYRRDDKGVLHLVFPVAGGNVKVAPAHPQYAQIAHYLAEATVPPDAPR